MMSLTNAAGTSMYVIEGQQLQDLIAQLQAGTSIPTYKLRIAVFDHHFTFKVNESTWSPPVGRAQEPY
jgi:hypothetical protein